MRQKYKKHFKQKNRRHSFVKRIAFAYAVFVVALGVGYLEFGVLTQPNPNVVFSDIHTKLAWASSTVGFSHQVYGTLSKPSVSASSGCENGSSYVYLSWGLDPNATGFEITRDGTMLAGGITSNSYRDYAVLSNFSHEYVVTAIGPHDTSTSDTLSILTDNCPVAGEAPTVDVRLLNGESVSEYEYESKIVITDQTPTFSGNSNAPNARVYIRLTNDPHIVTIIDTNENGHWEWTSSRQLEYGKWYTLYVTAEADSGIFSDTRELNFKVTRESSLDEESSGGLEDYGSGASAVSMFLVPQALDARDEVPVVPAKPFEQSNERIEPSGLAVCELDPRWCVSYLIEAEILNDNQTLNPGELLHIQAGVLEGSVDVLSDLTPTASILDSYGEVVDITRAPWDRHDAHSLYRSFALLETLVPGQYTLRLETVSPSGVVISSEKVFSVKEPHFVNLGGGAYLTPSQILSMFGWFVLATIAGSFLIVMALIAQYGVYVMNPNKVEGLDLKRNGDF